MAATRGLAAPGAAWAQRLAVSDQRGGARGRVALAALVGLTGAGLALRVLVARQSVFADELSTYWISARHSLGGVLSLLYSTGRIQHAEITPPLSFLASWLTTRLGGSPELLRLPALLAGTATIPLVYLLGVRAVGRRAALLAAALTAFSPFMIYYSAEARAYGLLMLLLTAAVLSMLMALHTHQRRYWVLYALCSAAAFYTHYTCLFVLGAALLWVIWVHPEARRTALLANAGAALLVAPWIPGLIADTQSPTVRILSALSPFTAHAVRIDIQHWSVGYPYSIVGLRQIPGVPALILLGVAVVLALVGLARRVLLWRRGQSRPGRSLPRVALGVLSTSVGLMFVLMLATPVGEAVASAFGRHIIGVRDLAASWPFLALFCSALAIAAGRRLGGVVAALAVVAFAIGAIRMLEPRFQRPDYQGAADYVAAHARPGDVVIDTTGALSPGPLTGFDIVFHRRLAVVRARSPAERDHPFTVFDPIVSAEQGVSRALALAHGHRVFAVVPKLLPSGSINPIPTGFPPTYRLTTLHRIPGIQTTLVGIYSRVRGRSS